MKPKTIAIFLTSVLCAGGLTGCKTAQYVQHSPQTYFDFPNSNVTPLGPVKVKIAGPSSFIKPPDLITSDNDNTVYQAALAQQPGANLVINYEKMYTAYGFFLFGWSTLELEGTACKMDVGQQTSIK